MGNDDYDEVCLTGIVIEFSIGYALFKIVNGFKLYSDRKFIDLKIKI